MKKELLEKYLGKQVTITLLRGEIITGELQKTGTEIFKNNSNLYIPKNYYTLIKPDCYKIFRSSHVKKIQLNIGGILW